MRLVQVLAIALLPIGCGGLSASELPERAIALRWFDAETLRGRTEMIERYFGGPAKSPRGMPDIDDFKKYMGRLLGAEVAPEEGSLLERVERAYPGRMSFGYARSGKVEELALTPGAVPRSWSPDGKRLLFTQLVHGFRQLFALTRGSRETHPVTHGPGVHPDGCFGPDRRLVIVSTTVKDGRALSRLVITSPGGTRAKGYTSGPSDYAPACAPDGSAVVWVSVTDRGRDVLMSRTPALDGEVRRLGPGRDPAFSPDSQWIVYTARVGRRWALHRIRADGSGRRPIGTGNFNEYQPSFSPDGRLVVYISDNGLDQRFHVRRFDGTGDRVLFTEGGGSDPVW